MRFRATGPRRPPPATAAEEEVRTTPVRTHRVTKHCPAVNHTSGSYGMRSVEIGILLVQKYIFLMMFSIKESLIHTHTNEM